MSKSVLISIQPKWCELITNGKKTIEVRKTAPKIATPFKVYIYCTADRRKSISDTYIPKKPLFMKNGMAKSSIGKEDGLPWKLANGKVIGEFVCDKITDCRDINGQAFFTISRMSLKEWIKYTEGHKGIVWAWHISNLVIYDKPRELREFIRICPEWEKGEITEKCLECEHLYRSPIENFIECDYEGELPITRPPQSWCYVEGGANE